MLSPHVRLLRPGLAALLVLLATGQAPSGFPKRVEVPALVMTGLGAPETTAPAFTPKTVKVPELQMTGAGAAADKTPPFSPKKVIVPPLQMTGVN